MPLIRNTAVASGKNEGNSVGSKELSLVTVAVLTPPWSRLPGIATSGRGQLCETDMARARNIKPAFFDNDRLGETEPLARLMFIGMWTIADFNGNLVWREKRIKAKLLPYDDCDVVKLAINLEKSGVIRFYSNGDDVFCNIKGFSKHQNPHKNEREAGTEIPEFTENMAQLVDLSTLTINRDKSGTSLEQYGTDRASSLIPLPDSLNLIPEQSPPFGSSVEKWHAATCDLPVTINPTAWSAWCKYKSESKKPIKQTTAKLQWEFLAQYPHDVQLEIVEQSIRSGWQGLFEPKKRIESATEFIDRHTDTSWRDELNNTPSIPAIEFYGDKKTGG